MLKHELQRGTLTLCVVLFGAAATAVEFHPVDLSAVLQRRLSTYKPSESWSAPPRGRQVLAGVPFEIEGKIEVTGLGSARDGKFFPTRVSGIKVGRKCDRLHVLHGTGYDDKDGSSAARLVLRSEEHTSELQSRLHLVCRLLLEKKKKNISKHKHNISLHLNV